MEWNGVFPAIITPFKQDESIDFDMFEKNLKYQIDAGIHGVILAGSLGETSTLNAEERIQLLEFAMEKVGGKIPVILNVAEQRTKDAIDLIHRANDLNVDGYMMLPPMRYNADDAETVGYFIALAQETDQPCMIYNNPVDYKIEVTLDMFEYLAEIPNITAVKESTRDTTNITRMINAFGDRYKILCGVDTLAVESLVMGADGWVAGLVDAFPKETVVIYELIQQGKIQEAVEIFRWFLPLLELDIYPKLVQYIKLAATKTGISTEYVRSPRVELEGEERRIVEEIIDNSLANRPDLSGH